MTNEEKILRKQALKPLLAKLNNRRERLEKMLKLTNDKWLELRKEFEKLDRELAMVDGRFEKVKKVQTSNVNKLPQLNMAQLLTVAKQLGIQVNQPKRK